MGEEYANAELRAAREALDDAEVLADGGGSVGAIVNRLYYACFHAAQASLDALGESPSSHAGVLSLFGERLVLEDRVNPELGRFLNELYQYREEADYAAVEPDVDTDELRERAVRFVDGMEDLVDELS